MRLKTRRTQVDRLLDAKSHITLSSLERAAAMVGRSIPIMPYDGGGGHTLDMKTWRRIVQNADNIALAKITTPFPPKVKWLHDEFGGKVAAFGGSDQTILLCLANGASGLTVAGANVPQAFAEVWRLYRCGQQDAARRAYFQKISP
jgi:dihydrodipicolinate synthase/N-acetylneuraminate lyase